MVRKIVLSLIAVLGICAVAMAQNQQVSGTVTDAAGAPVAGATVMVDGTTVGTTTSADGAYSISVPREGVLLVTFIGYEPQRIAVAGKTRVNVVMKEDTQAIDDVIVVAYGTAKKEAFTGSASVMKAEDIGKRQVSNISNALAGAVAGVQAVSSNGQPGESAKIRIRGIGSMSASSAPLYIVDGAPYDGSLSFLNSADIESITVLKDAAASAIYGARGANGVVLVTTKRGKSQDATVTFDAKWGTNSRGVPNYDVISDPGLYYELGYKALYNSKFYAGSSAADSRAFANSALFDSTNGGTGYNVYTLPEGQTLIGANGKLNPNAKLGYSDGQYYYTPDDWYDELFGSGNLRQEYNVSIAGASERLNYYLSAGYLDDSGIIKNSGFTRYSTRMKADYQAKKWLKVGGNIGFSHAITNSPTGQTDWGSSGNLFYLANMIAPIYPMYVRDADKKIMYDEHGNKIYDSGVNTNQIRSFSGGANPMISIDLDRHRTYTDAINGNWFATVTPVEGLNVTANISASAINRRANHLYNSYYGSYIGKGSVSVAQSRTFGVNQQYLASYKRTFAQKHNFDVLVGFENYSLKMQYLSGSNTDLYNPNVGELDNTIYETPQVSSYTDTYFTMGILSRVQYDYDGKYFFSASYRRDASSRFHPSHRWGNFWSVGAAWIVNKENFMSGTHSWLDMLKVKASIGSQGNDKIGNYRYVDTYRLASSNGEMSVAFLQKGNPNITWETNTNFNAGIEFGVLQNRISGSIEYFNRKTTDMLMAFPSAPSLGYSSYYANVGDMSNKGIEIDLNFTPIRSKNVQWDISVNLTHLKNKITLLPPERRTLQVDGYNGYTSGIYFYGQDLPMYTFYMKKYAGVSEDGRSMWYKNEGDTRTTTTEYSEADDYLCGNAIPDLFGGFGTSVSFFGFDFGINFNYQIGGKVYDSGYAAAMSVPTSTGSIGVNWHKDMLKAWTPENPNSNIPRLQYGDLNATDTSDRFLTDASYLTLQNINFGYTLPSKFTQKFGVGKLRIYLACENVFYWSKRKGLDPRYADNTDSQGVLGTANAATYSPIRTISGGINIQF